MNLSTDNAPKAQKLEAAAPTTTESTVPVLGEGFQEASFTKDPRAADTSDDEPEAGEDGNKPRLRERLFGLMKKKDDGKAKGKKKAGLEPLGQSSLSSQMSSPNYPYQGQASPQRNLHSSSPRAVSPAGSQIFERDVQESSLLVPNSPAIPSHIQTENHIPPVLDASSEAITNKSLNPDSVEIIMTSSHQPAAAQVTGITGVHEPAGNSWSGEASSHPETDDTTSNYGALDNADVRRLSFISFADVVQSEHAEHFTGRDAMHMAGLTSTSPGPHSSSPVRSPVSSPGQGVSPPESKSASPRGSDMSPTRLPKPMGSPAPSHTTLSGGELTIETMSQALKKTASGDLTGVRGQQMSPSSPDGMPERILQ